MRARPAGGTAWPDGLPAAQVGTAVSRPTIPLPAARHRVSRIAGPAVFEANGLDHRRAWRCLRCRSFQPLHAARSNSPTRGGHSPGAFGCQRPRGRRHLPVSAEARTRSAALPRLGCSRPASAERLVRPAASAERLVRPAASGQGSVRSLSSAEARARSPARAGTRRVGCQRPMLGVFGCQRPDARRVGCQRPTAWHARPPPARLPPASVPTPVAFVRAGGAVTAAGPIRPMSTTTPPDWCRTQGAEAAPNHGDGFSSGVE